MKVALQRSRDIDAVSFGSVMKEPIEREGGVAVKGAEDAMLGDAVVPDAASEMASVSALASQGGSDVGDVDVFGAGI
jgi:hypothetical protein